VYAPSWRSRISLAGPISANCPTIEFLTVDISQHSNRNKSAVCNFRNILFDMASVVCPFCGTKIHHQQFWVTANKPFCSNCGWNLNRAQHHIQEKAKTVRFLLIASGIAVAITAAMAIGKNDFPGFLPLPVLVGVISLGYAWEYRGAKRILNEVALGNKTDPSASGRAPLPSHLSQKVQALPRPRRVTLSPTGRISLLLFIMALAVVGSFIFVFVDNARDGSFAWNQLWPILLLLAIVPILASVMIFSFVKERKKLSLVRDGEVAVARVVEQNVIQRGKHSYNEITYEFALPAGPLIRKTEREETNLIFEDMLIPVFYNPSLPNDCAALCATCYRLPDAEN
jgi:hypothetical protein